MSYSTVYRVRLGNEQSRGTDAFRTRNKLKASFFRLHVHTPPWRLVFLLL